MLGKRLLLLLVFVLLGQLVVGEKLELNAKKLSANVSVSEEQLDLKIVRGLDADYDDPKMFGLVIGGCNVEIKAESYKRGGVGFAIKVGKQSQSVSDFSGISVTKGALKFTGFDAFGKSIPTFACEIAFEKVEDKFMIALALTGSVPPSFNLTSEAELYVPNNNKASKADALLIVKIGVPVLVLAILVTVSVIAGFLIQRRRKNKAALSEERANTKRLNDAKLIGEQLAAEQQAKSEPVKDKDVEAQKESNSEKKSKASSRNASLKAKKDGNEKKKQSKAKDDESGKTKQSKVGSISQMAPSENFSVKTADVSFGAARILSDVQKK